MMKNLKSIAFYVAVVPVQLVAIIAGLFIVPIGLLTSRNEFWPKGKIAQWAGWNYRKMHRYFWIWDNDEDGSMGDARGWWNDNSPFGGSESFMSQYWWLAVRNPANNLKRYVIGMDIRKHVFSLVTGQSYVRDDFDSTGFQIVRASGRKYNKYMLYWVRRWGNSNRAIVVQLGHKIKLEHNTARYDNELDYFKGVTIEINPFKDIS